MLVAFAATGCAAIKGMLKPMVCDCTPKTVDSTECPAPEDDEDVDTSPVEMAQSEISSSADAAETAVADQEATQAPPEKRKLTRKQPRENPLELIEPSIEGTNPSDAKDKASRLEALRGQFPLPKSISESTVILEANFDAGEGREVALVDPGHRIRIYSQTQRLADMKFAANLVDARPESADRTGTRAVKVIRDGTAQILTHWSEADEDGTVVYKVGLFKLIDSFVGTTFQGQLAVRAEDQTSFDPQGTYEFLRGEDHAYIRWIPASDDGGFDASEATVYKWNSWEGVYRVPKPPPTAPKRNKLQSHRSTDAAAPIAVK